ncbi:Cerevisin [Dactylellina cionopaga]|nr:Cerevisin [Dactylellina cionopaga]
MKSLTLLSSCLLLAAVPSTFAAPTPSSKDVDTKSNDPHGNYLFVLSHDEDRPWPEVLEDMGVNQTEAKTFGNQIRVVSMKMRRSEAHDMAALGNVAYMSKNNEWAVPVMHTKSQYRRRDVERNFRWEKRQAGAMVMQSSAPWGLERLSSRTKVDLGERRIEDMAFKYQFDRVSGKGVDVYILDSGINVDHVDFNGRAKNIFSVFGDDGQDNFGHGTHTAGIVGSLTYGVAKNVNLLGVKVFNDRGKTNDEATVAGIDAILTMHLKRKEEPGFMGSVVNMSFGSKANSVAQDDIIRRAVEAGVHIVTAAGNDGANACKEDPGRLALQMPVINVGSTDFADNRAEFSNWGKCVDVYAPGVSVVSTSIDGPRSVDSKQGTSVSAPMVAGLVADLLSRKPELQVDPAAMKKMIISMALTDAIKSTETSTTPEILANNGMVMEGATPITNTTMRYLL